MKELLIPDALGHLCWYMRFRHRLFGFTYACLLTSIVFALETINDVTLYMARRLSFGCSSFCRKVLHGLKDTGRLCAL